MIQERYVIMLPKPLKRRLRSRAADEGIPMRTFMVRLLEAELGSDWRNESSQPPGTQRLIGDSE